MRKSLPIALLLLLAIASIPASCQEPTDDPYAAPPVEIIPDEPSVQLDDGVTSISADAVHDASPSGLDYAHPPEGGNPDGDVTIPPVTEPAVERSEITNPDNDQQLAPEIANEPRVPIGDDENRAHEHVGHSGDNGHVEIPAEPVHHETRNEENNQGSRGAPTGQNSENRNTGSSGSRRPDPRNRRPNNPRNRRPAGQENTRSEEPVPEQIPEPVHQEPIHQEQVHAEPVHHEPEPVAPVEDHSHLNPYAQPEPQHHSTNDHVDEPQVTHGHADEHADIHVGEPDHQTHHHERPHMEAPADEIDPAYAEPVHHVDEIPGTQGNFGGDADHDSDEVPKHVYREEPPQVHETPKPANNGRGNRNNNQNSNRQDTQQETRGNQNHQINPETHRPVNEDRFTAASSAQYLDQYHGISEQFYQYAEHGWTEGLIPLYKQIRANPYLSMGFSALIFLYFLITFTRMLTSLFRSKPKFRYNKEEAVSSADINNNFKKFLSELEGLKKSIGSNVQGGTATQGGNAAAIPQGLSQEISYIAQNLSKNDDLIQKIIKEKKQIDNFLMEFQKEVVESNKAIWNELSQLRKTVAQGGRSGVPSSISKARTEASDKALGPNSEARPTAFNPEVENRGREPNSGAPNRMPGGPGSEPRSRSANPNDPSGIRGKQPVPAVKDRRPTGESQKADNGPVISNPEEPIAQQNKEEAHTAIESDKGASQNPFARIPNPTNAHANPEEGSQAANKSSDKGHATNPFGVVNNANTSAPALNIKANTNPFGNPMAKRPVPGARPTGGMPGAHTQGGETNGVPKGNTPLMPGAPEQHEEPKASEQNEAPVEENKQESPEEAAPTLGTEGDQDNGDQGGNKPFIPPMGNRPTIGMNAGLPRKTGPGVPGGPGGVNKGLPVPGIKKPGLPVANVFKGPPGNIPRAMPGQVKTMPGAGAGAGPSDGQLKSNNQV